MELKTPNEPSITQRNTMDTMTPGTAHGIRRSVRSTRLPGRFLFSSNAVPSPMRNAAPTPEDVDRRDRRAVPELVVSEDPRVVSKAQRQAADTGKVHDLSVAQRDVEDPIKRVDDHQEDDS